MKRDWDDFLASLSPLEPYNRHQTVKASRIDSTGHWIFETKEFKAWVDTVNHHSTVGGDYVFFCYGIPGAGKTVITSIMIDHLAALVEANPCKSAIAYFYCDYTEQGSQTTLNIVGSIIKQLLQLLPTQDIPRKVIERFERMRDESEKKRKTDAKDILLSALQVFDRVFLCIDALDELEERTRIDFFDFMQKKVFNCLFLDKESTVNSTTIPIRKPSLFLTGRPHIQHHVVRYFGNGILPMEIKAQDNDLRILISNGLERDVYPDAMTPSLKIKLLNTIVEKSAGMYVLPLM
ncbi:hypothetical protein BDZ91DRAFT_668941 [Kalaharituber pfeilii]|nr:hypothetical protein BDZ91DRAFT_668941 [Kalaharituber pfeilii]